MFPKQLLVSLLLQPPHIIHAHNNQKNKNDDDDDAHTQRHKIQLPKSVITFSCQKLCLRLRPYVHHASTQNASPVIMHRSCLHMTVAILECRIIARWFANINNMRKMLIHSQRTIENTYKLNFSKCS